MNLTHSPLFVIDDICISINTNKLKSLGALELRVQNSLSPEKFEIIMLSTNGNLIYTCRSDSGRIHGPSYTFDHLGYIISQADHNNGKLNGNIIHWDNGNEIRRSFWQNDRPISGMVESKNESGYIHKFYNNGVITNQIITTFDPWVVDQSHPVGSK